MAAQSLAKSASYKRVYTTGTFFSAISCCLLPALAFVLLALPPAHATNEPRRTTSAPDVRAIFNIEGRPGFCLAEHKYDDGKRLVIAVSPRKEINLEVSVPNAGFIKGEQYDLNLSLEKGAENGNREKPFSRFVRAIALDDKSILLQMGSNPKFREALANKDVLALEAAGEKIAFDLPDMALTLEKLHDCNRKAIETKSGKAKVMPEKLMALLAASGLNSIEPLPMDNIPAEERPSDYAWKTGRLLGGIRERMVRENKSLASLSGLYLQGLKKRCAGSFRAETGKQETFGRLEMMSVNAECVSGKRKGGKGKGEAPDLAVALLFYITDAGRFTVFTHESLLENKDEAAAARDSIRRVITKLASSE